MEVVEVLLASSVVERDEGGVGFVINLRFDNKTIPEVENIYLELNFESTNPKHGGSLMLWVKKNGHALLEGVALGGQPWPSDIDILRVREV